MSKMCKVSMLHAIQIELMNRNNKYFVLIDVENYYRAN